MQEIEYYGCEPSYLLFSPPTVLVDYVLVFRNTKDWRLEASVSPLGASLQHAMTAVGMRQALKA